MHGKKFVRSCLTTYKKCISQGSLLHKLDVNIVYNFSFGKLQKLLQVF